MTDTGDSVTISKSQLLWSYRLGGQERVLHQASCEGRASPTHAGCFLHDTAGFTSELWKPIISRRLGARLGRLVAGLGGLLPQQVSYWIAEYPEVISPDLAREEF